MPSDAWLNYLFEVGEVLIEERLLILVDHELDVVVVANNEHDALSGDSKLLSPAVEFCNWMRYIAITKGRNFLPIGNFRKDLVQSAVKVALK